MFLIEKFSGLSSYLALNSILASIKHHITKIYWNTTMKGEKNDINLDLLLWIYKGRKVNSGILERFFN